MNKIQQLCASRYKNYKGEPFQLTEGQSEIFEIIAKRKYPRVHCITYTQYGKSETVSMAILTRITTFPEKWAVVAPSNKKAKIIMGNIISHTFDNEYTMSMFEVDKGESIDRIRRERSKERMTYRHPNKMLGEVFTLSSEGKRTKDLLDALMGYGAPNVVIDESSLIDDIQYAGIFRMLGGFQDNFLFEIGNAMRRNHFHKTSLDPKFHHININYEQGIKEGRISADFIEEMRLKPMFSQLYENKFPPQDAVDSGGYAPLYNDEELKGRMVGTLDLFGELRMGCDVAGEGANYSVITLRGKNGAKILYKEHTPDTMAFVGKIVENFRRYQPRKIYIDKVGIGKPVYDRLKELPELYERVVGVMAGETPDDKENFFNKRAEMFWRQRDWLITSKLEGSDWLDLLDVRYKVQSDKKVKIKSKEDMIKEGVFSPDVADSLSLTFYDPDLGFEKDSVTVTYDDD
jgi:hypothetical protein